MCKRLPVTVRDGSGCDVGGKMMVDSRGEACVAGDARCRRVVVVQW